MHEPVRDRKYGKEMKIDAASFFTINLYVPVCLLWNDEAPNENDREVDGTFL